MIDRGMFVTGVAGCGDPRDAMKVVIDVLGSSESTDRPMLLPLAPAICPDDGILGIEGPFRNDYVGCLWRIPTCRDNVYGLLDAACLALADGGGLLQAVLDAQGSSGEGAQVRVVPLQLGSYILLTLPVTSGAHPVALSAIADGVSCLLDGGAVAETAIHRGILGTAARRDRAGESAHERARRACDTRKPVYGTDVGRASQDAVLAAAREVFGQPPFVAVLHQQAAPLSIPNR